MEIKCQNCEYVTTFKKYPFEEKIEYTYYRCENCKIWNYVKVEDIKKDE